MKIALSTTVIQRGKSGVGQYVIGLLSGLAKVLATDRVGISLTLLGFPSDRPLFERWLGRDEGSFLWRDVPENCRPALRDLLWHQTRLRTWLRKEDIQVLHIPSYRRIVCKPPCRQLVTIHDCAAFHLEGKYDPARMFFGRAVAPWLARRADRIITVSEATAADITRHFGIPRKALEVVYNGIDDRRFRPIPGPELLAWQKKRSVSQTPYYIYVARLEHPAKNHVRLIEAFEIFKKKTGLAHQLLFGGADWHGAEVVHQRIGNSPFRDAIRPLGFVDPDDLPYWYAGAVAMVYPSLFEGFGFPPLEAMACGCPVLCSGRGSLEEVTGEACLRIDPENALEMAAALESTTRGEGLQSLRTLGLARSKCFRWEAAARAVLGLYTSLSGHPSF